MRRDVCEGMSVTFERPGNKLVHVHVSTMRDRSCSEITFPHSLLFLFFFSPVCLQTLKHRKWWFFQWCYVILLELI